MQGEGGRVEGTGKNSQFTAKKQVKLVLLVKLVELVLLVEQERQEGDEYA